jgi:hypothetical protein
MASGTFFFGEAELFYILTVDVTSGCISQYPKRCTFLPASPSSLPISCIRLCVGTGRASVSQLSQLDNEMTSLATLPNFTLSAVRDIRLGLSAKLYQTTEAALRIVLGGLDNWANFVRQIMSAITGLDGLGRLLTPLPSKPHAQSRYYYHSTFTQSSHSTTPFIRRCSSFNTTRAAFS